MLMPVQMLSGAPAEASVVPAMPCHHAQQLTEKQTAPVKLEQTEKEIDNQQTSSKHCPGCMTMLHTGPGDGCGGCCCANLGSVLSTQVAALPLMSPAAEYSVHYLFHFASVPSLPLLRPPQSV